MSLFISPHRFVPPQQRTTWETLTSALLTQSFSSLVKLHTIIEREMIKTEIKKHLALNPFIPTPLKSRGIFRTFPNIYDKTFSENSKRLKSAHYFHEMLHLRCLAQNKC